jgi:hypothetical protein
VSRETRHDVTKQSWPLEPKNTWRAIEISLTCTLEESKEHGVEACDTRSREIILVVGARGHEVSDWNFTGLDIGGIKGI